MTTSRERNHASESRTVYALIQCICLGRKTLLYAFLYVFKFSFACYKLKTYLLTYLGKIEEGFSIFEDWQRRAIA